MALDLARLNLGGCSVLGEITSGARVCVCVLLGQKKCYGRKKERKKERKKRPLNQTVVLHNLTEKQYGVRLYLNFCGFPLQQRDL